MEASNELIKKLLEYNFIRINHEPYKRFQNEELFNALKYANNRDSDAESLYLKLDKERADVEAYNFNIKRKVESALDVVVEEAKKMFLNRWVSYNFNDNSLSSCNMRYMYVKKVFIDDTTDIEHTSHHIMLGGPSVYISDSQYAGSAKVKYEENESITFLPAVYYRDEKESKELVRYSQLHYSTENAFNERIDAIIARLTTNIRESRNQLLDKAVPNDA